MNELLKITTESKEVFAKVENLAIARLTQQEQEMAQFDKKHGCKEKLKHYNDIDATAWTKLLETYTQEEAIAKHVKVKWSKEDENVLECFANMQLVWNTINETRIVNLKRKLACQAVIDTF